MQVNDTMDVGQWLSFMSGYRMTKNLPKTSAGKLNEFVKAINSDLRGVIETSTPVFFMYDASVYYDAMQEVLLKLKTVEGSQYISYIDIGSENIQRDDPDFYKHLSIAINKVNIPNISPEDLVKKVLTGNKSNNITSFASIVRDAVTSLNEKISSLSGRIAQGDPAAVGKARLAATAAGRLVRQGFSKLTPCTLSNPETILTGYDKSKHAVLIGASFANLRDGVNKYLNETYRNAFLQAGIILSLETTKKEKGKEISPTDLKKRFQIGDFVVFGHTGSTYRGEGGISKLIGINTPWTQQLLLIAANAGSQSSGIDILNNFASTSGHVDLSIQFTKEVSADIGILMTGSMAMVVPMPYAKNSKLTEGESTAANQAVSNLYGPGSTYLKIRNSLKDTIFSAEGIKKLVTGLRFSPTATESFSEVLVAVLLNKPSKKTKAKSKQASVQLGKEVSTSKSTAKAGKKASIPKLPKARFIKPSGGSFVQTSLLDLQNLINRQLQDVISANMGDGSSRNVLNYRTGRLAASAKVESLSESRSGMITAFYSYMKNPYATFSEGGKQANPKSRDPKLLIAKSIREIAATQVANKLRAVVI